MQPSTHPSSLPLEELGHMTIGRIRLHVRVMALGLSEVSEHRLNLAILRVPVQ